LTGAKRSRILLINTQTRQVLRDVISGYPLEEKGNHNYEQFEQGISGWVVRERRSALVPDVLADERSVGRSRATSIRRGTKSVAVAPLIVRGEVIGTLTAVNLREGPVFTQEDLALVEQLAAQAAIAIENARLYAAAQQEIAERKRAEESLRESEQRYRLLFERSLAGVYRTSPDGQVLDCNAAFARILGYDSREEAIGCQAQDFYFDDAEREAFIEQLREQGEVTNAEFRLRRKDGSVVWVLENSNLIEGEEGAPAFLQGTFFDITERKRAEEELIRLSNAVKMSTDSIVVSDLEAKIIDVNEATLKMYGTDDKKDLIGRNSFDLIAPEDRGKALAGMEEVHERGYVRSRKYYIITEDGSRIPVEINTALMKDADGKPIGFVGVSRDITERKRAERLLRALNEAARAMEQALTPEEIFAAVTGQFKKLNFSCTVLLTDESQKRLLPKYFSYEARAIRTAEKLVGLKAEDFSIPVEAVDAYRKVIRERETVFVESTEEVVRQLLPGPAKRLARQIARMLKVSKSIDAPLIVEDEIIGLLLVQSDDLTEEDIPSITAFAHQMAAAWRKARLMQDLKGSLAERKRAQEELRQSYVKLQRALEGTVNALVSAIEMRDRYTAGHQRRVTQLACAIADEMGLPEERIEGLRMAGLIHDLGKINVPAEILSKPGRLDDIEYGLVKAHPQVGYDILKSIDFPWPVAEIVLQHHERMDGSGYPQGLSGQDILLEARILAIADVVEAMASHRPYRPAHRLDRALEEISQNKGTLYDPEAVDACLRLFTEKGFEFE
jgi:PAS domain S-box-containing protein